MQIKTALVAMLLVAPALATAGGTATVETTSKASQFGSMKTVRSSDTMRIDWRDTHNLRLETEGEDGYLLVHKGEGYSVSKDGGQTRVVSMASMIDMMRAMNSHLGGKKSGNAKPMKNGFGHIDAIEATGKTETVADIKGRVYQMTYTNADGKETRSDAVLTDDPLVTEFTRAYMGSMAAMFGAGKQSQDFLKQLPRGKRGLLRFGDRYKIKTINDTTPPASHYKLPAKPMDMSQMGQ